MDTMNFTMPINLVHAEYALLNVLHAQLHPPHAHPAILGEIDSLELMLQDAKLVFANLDTTPLLMDHVFNPTVILILSALSASKDLDFVSNVWPQGTESLKIQKPFVSVWTDSMLMLTIPVSLALVDACSAPQLLTAPAVLFWPLLMELELEPAHAPQRPTSLSQLKVPVIVLHVDPTAMCVLIPIPAHPVLPLSPRPSTTNVSAQQRTSSIVLVNVFHAQLDASLAPQQLTAADVLSHLCFKEQSAKLAVMMDLLLLDQCAKDAQLDACNALKTLSASTALMASTCTTVPATAFVLLEPLEIAHQVTGTVSHATLLA